MDARPIKIHKIGEDPDLTTDEKFEAVSIAMSEWAICQALVIVNGRHHGWRKYYELGGCVDQDADGDPVIMWRTGMKSRM